MRKGTWAAGAGLALLALAACEQLSQPADPLAAARRTCASERAEAEARMEACSTLIDSGELSGAERAEALSNRGAATYEAGDVTGAQRDFRAADLDVIAARQPDLLHFFVRSNFDGFRRRKLLPHRRQGLDVGIAKCLQLAGRKPSASRLSPGQSAMLAHAAASA